MDASIPSGPPVMFQSTHPRGVRPPLPRPSACKAKSFNPRTRVGCDGFVPSAVCNTSEFQSTHPRGVRPARSSSARVDGQFQSTHPRGVRHEQDFMPSREVVFQSTHPRGVRPFRAGAGASGAKRFNPRTRVGCDGASVACVLIVTWFQSTHPRGVRLRLLRLLPDSLVVSIHAPAWGASPDGIAQLGQAPVSIHAPAWGATFPCFIQ